MNNKMLLNMQKNKRLTMSSVNQHSLFDNEADAVMR